MARKCGECLMERVEVVELNERGVCPTCGSDYGPEAVAPHSTRKARKVYLGDGAYAELVECGDVVLTAEDGITATDTIVLEPVVLRALMAWLSTHGLR